MNVLSLFDGMSCGQIALNRAGIKYESIGGRSKSKRKRFAEN